MDNFLKLAFLFCLGSHMGWWLELVFRNVIRRNKKWINPGFCTGPYVPLYGFGLCTLYLLATLEQYSWIENPVWNRILLFAMMTVSMTVIEYIAGILCLKVFKVRLWDYSRLWGNIQGIICPLFSFFWAVFGALYYFFVHPHILDALQWLSQNLAFSFFIGLFFGVFFIDVAHSAQLVVKLRAFAKEHDIVANYEAVKSHIRNARHLKDYKYRFFSPFRSDSPLTEHLKEMYETFEKRREKRSKAKE